MTPTPSPLPAPCPGPAVLGVVRGRARGGRYPPPLRRVPPRQRVLPRRAGRRSPMGRGGWDIEPWTERPFHRGLAPLSHPVPPPPSLSVLRFGGPPVTKCRVPIPSLRVSPVKRMQSPPPSTGHLPPPGRGARPPRPLPAPRALRRQLRLCGRAPPVDSSR